MIRHLVALRFLPNTAPATKTAIYADLAALSQHIGGILDFQSSRNVSPETAVVRGFDDAFWFDFRDAAARDAYLIDPAHQAIGARIVAATGGIDGVFVCDVAVK
jgi:hypothetical protein